MSAAEIAVMLLVGVWVFVPALLPNSAAVVFGGGTPVDFGRSWRGKRILGDGKTCPICAKLFDRLIGIQKGEQEAPEGWIHVVE